MVKKQVIFEDPSLQQVRPAIPKKRPKPIIDGEVPIQQIPRTDFEETRPDKEVIKQKIAQSVDKVVEEETQKTQQDIKKEQEEKLDSLVAKSFGQLYRIQSVFPFDLFPDEIIVDRTKVDVINREFLSTAMIRSVLLKDITDVMVQTSIMFAKLTIVARSFADQVLEVKFLKKQEAIRARRIIQGLVAAVNQGVDLAPFSDEELMQKIEDLGQAISNEDKMAGI